MVMTVKQVMLRPVMGLNAYYGYVRGKAEKVWKSLWRRYAVIRLADELLIQRHIDYGSTQEIIGEALKEYHDILLQIRPMPCRRSPIFYDRII